MTIQSVSYEPIEINFNLPIPHSCEQITETAKTITCLFMAIVLDLLIFPGALALMVVACTKVDFNPRPEDVKSGKTPILLLHGSGFNDIEWLIGRKLFLNKAKYGSVFSMNYDGLIFHDNTKAIDDYATVQVRREIKKITDLTKCNDIILIGHSMGGLIAEYYAENCAKEDNISVNHVITIASPSLGAPIIDFIMNSPLSRIFLKGKRHYQMSVKGGTSTDPHFRHDLVTKAQESEARSLRNYYSISSYHDILVPGSNGIVTNVPERKRIFSYLGHYSIIVHPRVWQQIRTWLDDIYR